MVLFRKLPVLKTFGEVADYVLKKITMGNGRIAFFVTDQYVEYSIKSMEREKRSSGGTMRVDVLRRDQNVPKQFSKFLGSPENKTSLVKILFADWSTHAYHVHRVADKEIFITIEDKAYCISTFQGRMRAVPVEELHCKQEEADTKMLLCASFASTLGVENIKIITVDTDVLVLAIYHQQFIDCSIFLEYGTGNHTRLYDIRENSIPPNIINVLPSFHAITGCDSTSSFSGVGKGKAYKVLVNEERFIDAISIIGEEINLQHVAVKDIEEYICSLYGAKDSSDINELRYTMFTSGKKLPDPQRLPPTADALKLHLKRYNYQVLEWKKALDRNFELPDSDGHGWCKNNGKLTFEWVTQLPAPELCWNLYHEAAKKAGNYTVILRI